MKHLTPSEFIDAADGLLARSRAAHLDTCADCRAQAAGLSTALAEARAAEATEPSPLFWDHLSARIHEAVATESMAPRPLFGSLFEKWVGRRAFVPAAAGIVAAVVIATVALVMREAPPAPPAIAGNGAPLVWTAADVNPADSDAWQILTSAASDMPYEDAHAAGMHVPPAAIDSAVQRLNEEELNELGRLLQAELKRSGD